MFIADVLMCFSFYFYFLPFNGRPSLVISLCVYYVCAAFLAK